VLKTLSQIGAGGFFANGMQVVFAQQLLDAGDFIAGRYFYAYPFGLRNVVSAGSTLIGILASFSVLRW
jgi:hypothetical protein